MAKTKEPPEIPETPMFDRAGMSWMEVKKALTGVEDAARSLRERLMELEKKMLAKHQDPYGSTSREWQLAMRAHTLLSLNQKRLIQAMSDHHAARMKAKEGEAE